MIGNLRATAHRNELSAFVEQLFSGSHGNPVTEHLTVAVQDAISLVTKETVCQVNDVFNIM
jgi:hypothetical protein